MKRIVLRINDDQRLFVYLDADGVAEVQTDAEPFYKRSTRTTLSVDIPPGRPPEANTMQIGVTVENVEEV